MTAVSDVTDTIRSLRAEVCALHEQLTRYQQHVDALFDRYQNVYGQR